MPIITSLNVIQDKVWPPSLSFAPLSARNNQPLLFPSLRELRLSGLDGSLLSILDILESRNGAITRLSITRPAKTYHYLLERLNRSAQNFVVWAKRVTMTNHCLLTFPLFQVEGENPRRYVR